MLISPFVVDHKQCIEAIAKAGRKGRAKAAAAAADTSSLFTAGKARTLLLRRLKNSCMDDDVLA